MAGVTCLHQHLLVVQRDVRKRLCGQVLVGLLARVRLRVEGAAAAAAVAAAPPPPPPPLLLLLLLPLPSGAPAAPRNWGAPLLSSIISSSLG